MESRLTRDDIQHGIEIIRALPNLTKRQTSILLDWLEHPGRPQAHYARRFQVRRRTIKRDFAALRRAMPSLRESLRYAPKHDARSDRF